MNTNYKLLYYTLVALEIQLNINYKFYPFLQRYSIRSTHAGLQIWVPNNRIHSFRYICMVYKIIVNVSLYIGCICVQFAGCEAHFRMQH